MYLSMEPLILPQHHTLLDFTTLKLPLFTLVREARSRTAPFPLMGVKVCLAVRTYVPSGSSMRPNVAPLSSLDQSNMSASSSSVSLLSRTPSQCCRRQRVQLGPRKRDGRETYKAFGYCPEPFRMSLTRLLELFNHLLQPAPVRSPRPRPCSSPDRGSHRTNRIQ